MELKDKMELKDVVAVAGQSGLHKIIGRSKNGLILESLGNGKRFATGFQDRVSVLEDISMYTVEGDMKLADVFLKLKDKEGIPSPKDEVKAQRQFLVDTIGLESERVYDSDVRKLITWFDVLKDQIDFEKLKAGNAEEEGEEKKIGEDGRETKSDDDTKIKKDNTPKAPKNIKARTNLKGSSSKTTYRPKSGT